MRQASLATKIGTTAELRPGTPDVIVTSEPTLGATLRTKGRFYFLCEVARQHGDAGADIAREVADLARQEYYYDLSAGIEVSLRKALRQANRRAAQRLRDQRGRVTLHCACAVVVNNELYAARIGAAQVFLVRRARLFLPGDEPGELADFVHRTTTREAESLGGVADLLPDVWRQSIEPGDTLILASGALIDGLGAEALKNAAVTLHPRAAAEHINNRAVADGVIGSAAALFIEITAATAAAARVQREPEPQAAEVVIAENIRSRFESFWRRRPKIAQALEVAAAPAAKAVGKTVAVGFELMPRRAPPLPRRPDTARDRSRRQRRAASLLAVLLILVAGGIGFIAYRDYEQNRIVGQYTLDIIDVGADISAAERFADRKPPDNVSARQKVDHARALLNAAAKSPAANQADVAKLRAQIDELDDKISGVILDLARAAPGAKPTALVANVNGLYAADPGSGNLWRILTVGEPSLAGPVLTKGTSGVASPRAVAVQNEVVYSLDDQNHLWRAEGNEVLDVTPDDAETWKSADAFAMFVSNLYVLDATSGQVWKHESRNGKDFNRAQAYLSEPIPAGIGRSIAIDQDIWIVTAQGEILRFRRLTTSFTATRVDFTPRWRGEPVKPTAVQAIDIQSAVYFLDAPNRRVVQMTRDGGELARFALPANLAAPSAFYVSEGSRTIFTIHGSKVVATELRA
jgi:hypothetical protein